jgi:hypothetical protein
MSAASIFDIFGSKQKQMRFLETSFFTFFYGCSILPLFTLGLLYLHIPYFFGIKIRENFCGPPVFPAFNQTIGSNILDRI